MCAMSSYIAGVVVNTTAATSTAIRYSDQDCGRFHVPAASTITSITWYDAPVWDGTFVAANDEDGLAVEQTVAAGNSYEIPAALLGSAAIKAVGNAAGTIDVNTKVS